MEENGFIEPPGYQHPATRWHYQTPPPPPKTFTTKHSHQHQNHQQHLWNTEQSYSHKQNNRQQQHPGDWNTQQGYSQNHRYQNHHSQQPFKTQGYQNHQQHQQQWNPYQYHNQLNPESFPNHTCGPCNRSFNSVHLLQRHLKEHVCCPFPECQLNAHPKVIERHIDNQHLLVNFANLQIDDEAWIAERKRRFPTLQRAKLRRAEQLEKAKRGERLGKSTKPFSKGLRGCLRGGGRRKVGANEEKGKGRMTEAVSSERGNKKRRNNTEEQDEKQNQKNMNNFDHDKQDPEGEIHKSYRSHQSKRRRRARGGCQGARGAPHRDPSLLPTSEDFDDEVRDGIPAFKGTRNFYETTGEFSYFGFKSKGFQEEMEEEEGRRGGEMWEGDGISDEEEESWMQGVTGVNTPVVPSQTIVLGGALGCIMGAYSDSGEDSDTPETPPKKPQVTDHIQKHHQWQLGKPATIANCSAEVHQQKGNQDVEQSEVIHCNTNGTGKRNYGLVERSSGTTTTDIAITEKITPQPPNTDKIPPQSTTIEKITLQSTNAEETESQSATKEKITPQLSTTGKIAPEPRTATTTNRRYRRRTRNRPQTKKTPGVPPRAPQMNFPRRRKTLLHRLLLPNIAKERNLILQCVRFIVENEFFEGKGSEKRGNGSEGEKKEKRERNDVQRDQKEACDKNEGKSVEEEGLGEMGEGREVERSKEEVKNGGNERKMEKEVMACEEEKGVSVEKCVDNKRIGSEREERKERIDIHMEEEEDCDKHEEESGYKCKGVKRDVEEMKGGKELQRIEEDKKVKK